MSSSSIIHTYTRNMILVIIKFNNQTIQTSGSKTKPKPGPKQIQLNK